LGVGGGGGIRERLGGEVDPSTLLYLL